MVRTIVNMTVGVHGVGKSQFVSELSTEMLNRGKTMFTFNTDDYYTDKTKDKVARRQAILKVLTDNIGKYDFIIIDGTNISKKERKFIINLVNTRGFKIIANFFCVAKKQDGTDVTDDPTLRELSTPLLMEGFSNIIYMNDTHQLVYDNAYNFVNSLKDGLSFKDFVENHPYKSIIRNYDQNSPYHKDNLDMHMYLVYSNAVNHTVIAYTRFVLTVVAAFHDIGKPYVREDLPNGNSRYVGHENVSAYLTARLLGRFELATQCKNDILTVISYHMLLNNNQVKKKKLRMLRDKMGVTYEALVRFNQYDVK